MAKMLDADLTLKLRVRRIFYSQQYWAPMEVELSEYFQETGEEKRQSLTDVDVLGIRYDGLFTRKSAVADCKSGQTVKDIERLFWISGVKSYFGADEGYFVRPVIKNHAKVTAPKLRLRILDDASLGAIENNLGIASTLMDMVDLKVQERIIQMWGHNIPKGVTPTEAQLKMKNIYNFLSYRYWYSPRQTNLINLISHFNEAAELISPSDERHILLCYTGAERLAHCLIDIAQHVVSTGNLADIPRTVRLYVHGGALTLKEKESTVKLISKISGQVQQLDPNYWPDILEIVGRIIRYPNDAIDIMRHLFAMYFYCVLLGHKDLNLSDLPPRIGSVVLAKAIATTFAKAAGFSPDVFKALAPL